MFSSEQKLSINGPDKATLLQALKYVSMVNGKMPKAYKCAEGKVLFYEYDVATPEQNIHSIPSHFSMETLASIVWDYLNSEEAVSSFAEKPWGIDGGLERGWEIFIPAWEHDPSNISALLVGVKPDWIYYAK